MRQELISLEIPTDGVMVMPDIEPFVSPVDGTVITGRKALREHNKRHNVTNAADYRETWREAAKRRERFLSGDPSFDQARRKESLIKAYDQTFRRK